MWFLIQTNVSKTRYKFLCTRDYDKIMKYIKSFVDVVRKNEYEYQSNDIIFYIRFGEEMR